MVLGSGLVNNQHVGYPSIDNGGRLTYRIQAFDGLNNPMLLPARGVRVSEADQ
jgi:hypothetical protein